MLGGIGYREVCVNGLIIEIEKILHIECHDADVAGRLGFFSGADVDKRAEEN